MMRGVRGSDRVIVVHLVVVHTVYRNMNLLVQQELLETGELETGERRLEKGALRRPLSVRCERFWTSTLFAFKGFQ